MLANLKSKLLKSIQSKKLNVFIFFLILSFSFLMFSKLSKNYTDTITYHISYENVPEQHSIVPKHDSIIKIKVRAYGFNLITQNFIKHKYTVDFDREVRKVGTEYIWDTDKSLSKISSELGQKMEVLSILPNSIAFPFEIMTVKKVPVELVSDISYTSGYDISESLVIQPDSVKVIGPKNRVEKISKIKTEKLILKDVNGSFNEEVNLILDKSFEKMRLTIDKVKVNGVVEKFTEGTFEVPVSTINLPADISINYFPKTVLVAYYVSLENYNKIKALDFKIECDYSEVKNQDGTFFTPKLVRKPELVKSAKIKQSKVEYIIIE